MEFAGKLVALLQ